MGLLYQLSQQLTGLKPLLMATGAGLALSGSAQDVPFSTANIDNFNGYVNPNYTIPWTGVYRVTATCHYSITAAAGATCGINFNLLVSGATVAQSVWQIDSVVGHGYAGPVTVSTMIAIAQGAPVKCQIFATNITSGNLGSGSQILTIEYIERL